MDICEKIAYIKGLTEGLKLDTESAEGKVISAIIDLLGDITEEICEIEGTCDEITEQLDAVDEDLSTVEDILYEEDEEDDDDDCDCDCCCGEDDELYEVECPACHDTVYFDECDLEEGGVDCPNCGTRLDFDFDCGCDCEDDGCDCCKDSEE